MSQCNIDFKISLLMYDIQKAYAFILQNGNKTLIIVICYLYK